MNNNNACDVTAIILAGGQGARLNYQNKGLIQLAEKSMLAHIIERLKPQTPNIIISANDNISRYQSFGYPVISDDTDNYQGPLAGMLSCQTHIKTKLVITLPCDTPLLPTNLLATMRQAYDKENTNHVCVAHDGLQRQNLFMLFSLERFKQLRDFFDNNQRKVGDWIESLPYLEVDFSAQAETFMNINTAENLDFVQKSLLHEQQ